MFHCLGNLKYVKKAGLWIRIGSRFHVSVDPDSESGSRYRKNEENGTFKTFLLLKVRKLVQTKRFFTVNVDFKNFEQNLTSNFLLWIRIRIGSGFKNFVDPDPD
jgi:hypothetical protein